MPTARIILESLASRKVLLWRFFWAAVLLLHVPISWRVFSGASAHPVSWSSALLLALANAFFLLEACRPCTIRLITDRRSAIVFVLIVALLHVGLLERGFPGLASTLEHGSSLLVTIAGTLTIARLLAMYAARVFNHRNEVHDFRILQSYLSRHFPSLILAPQVRAQPFAGRRGPPRR